MEILNIFYVEWGLIFKIIYYQISSKNINIQQMKNTYFPIRKLYT
jgi:hypothetical protein